MGLFGRRKGSGGGSPEPSATNGARPDPQEAMYGAALIAQQDAPGGLEASLPEPAAAGQAAPPPAQAPAAGGQDQAAGGEVLGGLGNLEGIFEDNEAAVDPAYQSLVDSVEEVDAARLSQELADLLRMIDEES